MILRPHTQDELLEWLRTRKRAALEVHGALAREIASDQVLMSALNRILLYEPDEMILQCEAGLPLVELDRWLADSRQWIPTLRAAEDLATTVGGALSANVYHPRGKSTLSLRTTVLGGSFMTSDGTSYVSGSRVVKSVAGYDTHRSFVGARGKLGIIGAVTLRVLPLPEAFVRFVAPHRAYPTLVKLAPTVLEPLSDGLPENQGLEEFWLVELSGFTEDIHEDREHLVRESLLVRELTEEEWITVLREVRARHIVPSVQDVRVIELLHALRGTLDPEGLLQ
jgi:hypothetical protein